MLRDRPARLIADPPNLRLMTHGVADILRARILAIACGYEDVDGIAISMPSIDELCLSLSVSGRREMRGC